MEMLNWLPFYIYLVNMILNIRLHSSHAHEFIFDMKKTLALGTKLVLFR